MDFWCTRGREAPRTSCRISGVVDGDLVDSKRGNENVLTICLLYLVHMR